MILDLSQITPPFDELNIQNKAVETKKEPVLSSPHRQAALKPGQRGFSGASWRFSVAVWRPIAGNQFASCYNMSVIIVAAVVIATDYAEVMWQLRLQLRLNTDF